MTPIRFGPDGRQIFGLLHRPGGTTNTTAALICNPFGQESIRTHRLMRLLSDRLARSGIASLRFDYYGTGDSHGEDEEADIDGWIDDLTVAHSELRRHTRAARIVWIGLRLGGTLASLASARVRRPPDTMVLWDPVFSGAGYLKELAAEHLAALRTGFGAVPEHWLQRSADGTIELADEALGFALPPHFRERVASIDAEAFDELRAEQITIVACPDRNENRLLLDRLRGRGLRAEIAELETAFDWTSEEAIDGAFVPTDALHALLATVEGRA